jgi:cell division protein FtsZ
MEEQLTLDNRSKTTESLHELKPRITVIGIGGAGGNAVNNMIRYQLEGVEFIAGNTDAQALAHSLAPHRIQLGLEITQGLGAGSRPDVGKAAAEETVTDVMNHIKGSHMVFITAGMGGGTGTGAAPVIAKAAREVGILTVGVVTKPFHFEGSHRMKSAEKGIAELQQYVDTLIVIPNQNLFRVANERTTFADAFKMADDVLYSGVRGVTDLMIMPGLINLDFADIRSVMGEMGKAMMGTGEAEGENRAVEAAEAAISNPLLDDVSMRGARGVLINITGGYDMTLFEVDEAANRIRQEVDPDANIIFGSTFDEKMEGIIRVSVVATGIDAETSHQPSHGRVSHGFGHPGVVDNTAAAASNLGSEDAEEFDDILSVSSVTIADSAKQVAEKGTTVELPQALSEAPHRRTVRKLSLFERLTGRRRQPEFDEEDPFFEQSTARTKTKVLTDEDLISDDNEELEIPAFLRRKK